jgi:CDP-glucose 4,6-dehydratase
VTAAFRASFFADGEATRVASARAGNVIGGGDWATDRLVPDLMRAALAGDTLVVRNPESIRPWQHVLEPLEGYLLLAQALCESPAFAEGWNFGPSPADEQSVRWVVERASQLWPQRVRWRAEPPPSSVESRILKLDSSLARGRLGWSPRWTLDEALRRTIDWFRAFEEGADLRRFTQGQIEAHGGELRGET